jgi:hypothetical protein
MQFLNMIFLTMAPKKQLLKFGLFNAGSLCTGHDNFLVAMNKFNADLVAINESWIRAGDEARAPVVPGYRLRNVPRPVSMRGGRGGGVAFYVKCGIRVRLAKFPDAPIEQMWLILTINSVKYHIGTAYRPQWISVDVFTDALMTSITSFANCDHLILLGDFNINLLENNLDVKKFNRFLHCTHLQQFVSQPTHFSSGTET